MSSQPTGQVGQAQLLEGTLTSYNELFLSLETTVVFQYFQVIAQSSSVAMQVLSLKSFSLLFAIDD